MVCALRLRSPGRRSHNQPAKDVSRCAYDPARNVLRVLPCRKRIGRRTGAILMSLFRRGDVWWYEFWFAGRRIQESSKSPSKTVAKNAEQKRRRELEEGFNNFTDTRHERVRTFSDVADEFFNGYKLRLPNSAVFADYAIDHLKRLLRSKMLVDFNEAPVIKYRNDRLDEGTAPKTINE